MGKEGGLEIKTYTFEEAKANSIEYFKGDEMAAAVWVNKYALKDSFGKIYEKHPGEMHRRIAKEIARIEKKYSNSMNEEDIYALLENFRYIIPQGSPMSGIGNNYQKVSLSNCFVIGEEGANADSYGTIMKIDQEQVQLMKRRGGVGHDLSGLRPAQTPVYNSALTSTGIIPFMERYSNSTREVAQDGRRGALMLSISSKHPDAEAFIDSKMTKGKITGANISVKIDDEFMTSIKENKKYTQQFPIDSEKPIIRREIDPKQLWNKIIHNAWKSAEPGILFWNTIIRESVPDCYDDLGYKTASTNPCGEIPLCPYDSCRLLAINLYSYVDHPFTDKSKFNFGLFKKHVGYAQRIMDDIIDLELEKIENILEKIKRDPESEEIKRVEKNLWEHMKHMAEEGRRTGIGITGEGDMLAALGLTYGTNEGNDFSEELHKTMALETYRSSVNLAKERGKFKIYDAEREKNNPFIKRLREADENLYNDMIKHGRRNIALLTIAPTGTTSIMTQTTSGLEPVFLPAYKRRKKVNPNDKNVNVTFVDEVGDSWEEYNVFHHKFVDWMLANGYDVTKKYSENEIKEMVEKSPYYKATSNDINWLKKVELQGRVQKWVDHSISVTINLPKDIPESLVEELYMKAWESGCKGVTVYREGSREGVLVTGEKLEDKVDEVVLVEVDLASTAIKEGHDSKYYNIKKGEDTYHLSIVGDFWRHNKTGKVYILPSKMFQNTKPLGREGSSEFGQSGLDRTGRLKSENPDWAEMVREWKSVTGDKIQGHGPLRINSPSHGVGLAFEHYCLSRGIVEYNEMNHLENTVLKTDLKKIVDEKEIKRLKKKIKNHHGVTEQKIYESIYEKFECPECGGTKYHKESGCNDPICNMCGWSKGTCD